MVTIDQLKSKEASVCMVGLGYVGLPLALILAKHFKLIGFDVNESRVTDLQTGHDKTGEVNGDNFADTDISFTSDAATVAESRFIIVAVPTPVDSHNQPDLTILKAASKTVGKHIQPGSVVVFESTVYPGVTEEVCLPILEKESGLVAGKDFFVGYSPERVNPGDKEHTIDKVVKVVAGMDEASTDLISDVYSVITQTYKATSIKVAEAAKVIENTQRDINIALVNELAQIFAKMDISVYDVLAAAGTKWNFLPFVPGLVGGHCIGVDPYYLTHKAEALGYKPEIILAGRGINDGMHSFVVRRNIEAVEKGGKEMRGLSVTILGITFKENVPDVRNSKVALLCRELLDAGAEVRVFDPIADSADVKEEYGISLVSKEELAKADVLILAVPHDTVKGMQMLDYVADGGLVVDIKHVLDKAQITSGGYDYLTL